ncbi:MAG: Cation diffusion facilitator family transporter [Actinomycetia bacterium]|nr:Cation diffusion facilitator family transporter [Actinomycetes bacterium]
MPDTIDAGATHRSVIASLAVNCAETLALGIAAWVTGSVALRAQTAASAGDVAVGVFLIIGVLSSARPADDTHPLGYGRERFFWSLFAALGIFIGSIALALEGALRAALHPTPVDDFALGYVVLITTTVLDTLALQIWLRPVRRQAAANGISLLAHLQRSTDPALVTVIVSGACAVIGGVVATAALVVAQLTGSPTPDTVASAVIGLLLLVASALLLRTNRDLLSGRGVRPPVLHEMRRIVAAQPGVVDVPDLFAIVVGPSSVIVDGDVVFEDALDVPAVEQTIMRAVAELRERWPSVDYVYLTPVARSRTRRVSSMPSAH